MFTLLFALLAAIPAEPVEWINSPEAAFVTAREREEWFRLHDDTQREAFRRRYWLMRDPTPGTERNEFKEAILDRIQRADRRFSITGGLRGSETAQGRVFIILGPPSRVRTANSRMDQSSSIAEFESIATWIYDTQRTPNLLKMLGRPGLEVNIAIQPMQRRDVLQTPGQFDHYRATLAERSVVNPRALVTLSPPELEVTHAALSAPLDDAIRDLLRSAKPGATCEKFMVAANALWTGSGSAAVLTVAVPNAGDRTTHLTTVGEIRDGERVVATFSEPFTTAEAVTAAPGTKSTVLRLDVPPGSYDASFAVVDDRSGERLGAVTMPLRIFDPAGDFAVSSIVMSTEPTRGAPDLFTIGGVSLHPHSDAQYALHEPLWYFATVHAKAGADGISTDVHVRRDGKLVASYTTAAQLQDVGSGAFLLGQTLPIARYGAGRYTLYVTVRQAEQSEVRRADFVIVP